MYPAFQRFHRRRYWAAAWTLLIGLAVTGGTGWKLHREAVDLDRQRLARRVAEIQSQLDSRLEKSEMLLHNLRDYLTWNQQRNDNVFQRWCYENGQSINCPWLIGIALATNRHQGRWPEGLSQTPLSWGSNEWRLLRKTALDHRIECDLVLTSPVTNTLRFLADYNLRGSINDRTRFANTLHTSRLAMSEHKVVMTDVLSNEIWGTCFLVPLFHPQVNDLVANEMLSQENSSAHRALFHWLHFSSIIVAPVDFRELVKAISEAEPDDVEIELFSSTNQVAKTWLNPTRPTPHASEAGFKPYLSHRQLWPMYAKRFSIYYYTTPLFEAQSPRRLAYFSMAAGTMLTLVVTVLVGVATRARNLQEQMTDQVREARDALAAAQVERNKISRDLHDGTIQTLYAIQLGLGHTVRKVEADPARAGRELATMRAELDAVIAEIRQFITADVGADKPSSFKLVLQSLIQRAQAGTTAKISVDCPKNVADRLAPAHAVQLANIAREALSNSLRHGNPRNVSISLRREEQAIVLEVADDGIGFDPDRPARSGVGLPSMITRAGEAQGTLQIKSSPGHGTRITVRLPAIPSETANTVQPRSWS